MTLLLLAPLAADLSPDSAWRVLSDAVNYLDVAPRNAGYAMSAFNTFGQAAGWLAPWALGKMTAYPEPDRMSREDYLAVGAAPPEGWVEVMAGEWRVVFLVAACVQGAGLVVYSAFASGERQRWDSG